MTPYLTPQEVLTHFRRKDRHSLAALVERGLVERINTGGEGKGARWLYRIKQQEQEPTDFAVKLAGLRRGHGL